MQEDGVNLLTIMKSTCTYRRSRRRDYVKDYLPPSKSEFKQVIDGNTFYRNFVGPVIFSTLADGTIVRGLTGVPDEGPVLLVGYHMLMGLELGPLLEAFLQEKKIMVRGIAHPSLFSEAADRGPGDVSFFDTVRLYGGLPVSASNFFKLFAEKSHVLLYPGGAREALHFKGEAYKLFWPDQPEFVRMAAKFGATIVPFGAVGEDDILELVLDYNDLMKVPILSDRIKKDNEQATQIREDQSLFFPGLLPKVPGRLYYMFGKPIELKGRQELSKDREKAQELYLEVKSQVENILAYLIKKREEDPYRSVVNRTAYRAFSAPMDRVPTFEP
ncbi:hypothetical protein Leryth_022963 [Lithospermum erythrorhizon]|nr:hypothetical protein Leryth_022963 [Lithospermum erythrorhizon]